MAALFIFIMITSLVVGADVARPQSGVQIDDSPDGRLSFRPSRTSPHVAYKRIQKGTLATETGTTIFASGILFRQHGISGTVPLERQLIEVTGSLRSSHVRATTVLAARR